MSALSWLLLAVSVVFALVAAQRRAWARFWFGVEDPRAIAALRIVFAFVALCNVAGLLEYAEFLFSDEGILPAAVARQHFAAKQFAGFGDGGASGEPWGFFDLDAFVQFATGPKFSVLFFWDSPTLVWVHVFAVALACVMLMVGLWTRVSAVACLLLMVSLFDRNQLFWEGTDVAIRVFVVYLVFARSGHAWSVDNWRRCRRLRADGRLSPMGRAPSQDEPRGSEAVYRLVPVWPRRLMMLQLAVIYFTTGALKNGALWMRGDAVYYALNMDHLYRVPPQVVTAWLGTDVLRVVTWAVKFGEMGFALVFIGSFLRVVDETRPRPATRVSRALLFVRTWLLGRRVWITWAVVTMAGIFATMNIGQFQTAMLALCLVYFRGDEIARAWARLRRRPAPIAAEDPTLPHLHRDAASLPAWALVGAAVSGCVGVALQLQSGSGGALVWAAAGFVLTGAAYAVAMARRARGAWPWVSTSSGGDGSCVWAYGPLGRWLVGALLTCHVSAVGLWLVPKHEVTTPFRKNAREWARPWMQLTRTTQGWGMFAPNPPRRNTFMQVLVTDADGQVWDMQSDVYAQSRRSVPFVFNDRMRKMNRRMIGRDSVGAERYRQWYARWQCRDFALRHDGRVPKTVELVRLSYRIPPPEAMAEHGWYRPVERLASHGSTKSVYVQPCVWGLMAQPSDHVARRHGVRSSARHRPFVKKRRAKWDARHER